MRCIYSRCRQGNLDDGAGNPYRIDRYRHGGGRSGRAPGGQVEAGTVQPALDLTVLNIPVGERHVSVAALIKQGMDPPTAAGKADPIPGQVNVHGSVIGQLAQRACWNPVRVTTRLRHPVPGACLAAHFFVGSLT